MDIGNIERIWEVEPLDEPVESPQPVPAPDPEPDPVKQPAKVAAQRRELSGESVKLSACVLACP
jgi:hypothetical protein